jgi:hypothetical protein
VARQTSPSRKRKHPVAPKPEARPKPKQPFDLKLTLRVLKLLDEGKRHPALNHDGLNLMLQHLAPVLDTSRALPRLFAHQFHVSGAAERALRMPPAALVPMYTKYRKDTIEAFRMVLKREPHPATCPMPYGQASQSSPPRAGPGGGASGLPAAGGFRVAQSSPVRGGPSEWQAQVGPARQ